MTIPGNKQDTTMSYVSEVQEHNRKVEEACPFTDIMTWKKVKVVFYAGMASGAYWMALPLVENPIQAFAIFMLTLILIYYGIEANEVEVAGLLTIILNGRDNNNGDE